jgi:hypothetical protein
LRYDQNSGMSGAIEALPLSEQHGSFFDARSPFSSTSPRPIIRDPIDVDETLDLLRWLVVSQSLRFANRYRSGKEIE